MNFINNQKSAVRQFVKEWTGKGYEKGETQRFWMALLHDVLGVEDPVKAIEFEIPVKTITKEKGSDFIDGYIPATEESPGGEELQAVQSQHRDCKTCRKAYPLSCGEYAGFGLYGCA